jgi:hypothetical protein
MDKIAVGRLVEDATSVRSMFRVESVTYDSTPVVCLLAESEGGLRVCVVVGPRVIGIVPGEEEGDTDKWCLDISDLFCRVWKAVKEWPTLNEEGAKTARMSSASGGGAMPGVSGG